MSARLFSIKDDLVLKELYSRFTNKELVQIFNGQFSRDQIKNRGKDLKLHKDNDVKVNAQELRSGVWESWEIEIIKKHYNKSGLDFVQNLIPNRTPNSIKHKASRMKIIVSKEIRNYANGPKTHSDITKLRMSEARLGKPFSDSHINNLKLSCHRGIDHHMWRGGRSKTPYEDGFNIKLKAAIKKRDCYQCQLCKKKPSWTKLIIHHIDFNKSNSNEKNLITLCKSCHVHHHLNISDEERTNEQIIFNNYISGKYIVV
jgi:hypothetical protein